MFLCNFFWVWRKSKLMSLPSTNSLSWESLCLFFLSPISRACGLTGPCSFPSILSGWVGVLWGVILSPSGNYILILFESVSLRAPLALIDHPNFWSSNEESTFLIGPKNSTYLFRPIWTNLTSISPFLAPDPWKPPSSSPERYASGWVDFHH